MIFDPIRVKWLLAQPEELVRQAVLWALLHEWQLPKAKIAIEYSITIQNKKHRCDIVLVDNEYQPAVIIEVKAPTEILSSSAFQQLSRYGSITRANYFWLTNGINNYSFERRDNKWLSAEVNEIIMKYRDLVVYK